MSIWLPLESNPDVLNKYMHKLGVSNDWALVDVVGLDAELLDFIPKPVRAIILLFPCSPNYEKHRVEENEQKAADAEQFPAELFYMRQVTHNACGTVALIHSVANNKDMLGDGILMEFLEQAKDLDPEARGHALENSKPLTENHEELAQQGQTTADPVEKVYHHFIALVNHDGLLYELDGRKSFPIKHGATSDKSFVEDAARVCKEFMARDPHELRFTIMALTAAQK